MTNEISFKMPPFNHSCFFDQRHMISQTNFYKFRKTEDQISPRAVKKRRLKNLRFTGHTTDIHRPILSWSFKSKDSRFFNSTPYKMGWILSRLRCKPLR